MEESEYIINKNEFKKLNNWAESIYNTTVVIDYFCKNQKEIEELCNLSPVIKNLRNDADLLNSFFINFEDKEEI